MRRQGRGNSRVISQMLILSCHLKGYASDHSNGAIQRYLVYHIIKKIIFRML